MGLLYCLARHCGCVEKWVVHILADETVCLGFHFQNVTACALNPVCVTEHASGSVTTFPPIILSVVYIVLGLGRLFHVQCACCSCTVNKNRNL